MLRSRRSPGTLHLSTTRPWSYLEEIPFSTLRRKGALFLNRVHFRAACSPNLPAQGLIQGFFGPVALLPGAPPEQTSQGHPSSGIVTGVQTDPAIWAIDQFNPAAGDADGLRGSIPLHQKSDRFNRFN